MSKKEQILAFIGDDTKFTEVTKTAFEKLDVNKNKTIEYSEFLILLENIGTKLDLPPMKDDTKIKAGWDQCSKGTGKIDYETFKVVFKTLLEKVAEFC